MLYSTRIENLILQKYSCGQIFATQIWKDNFSDIPVTAYNKTLERMEAREAIVKLAKGVYCVPKVTKFGKIPFGEQGIVDYYIGKNQQFGVEISYGLYSSLGLTTQVPKKRIVYTTKLDGKTKSYKNLDLIKINITLNEVRKDMVRGLEVVQNLETIQEINYVNLYSCFEKLAKSYDEKEFMKVTNEIKYKKRTLAFYHNILNWFGVENGIGKLLSPTSKYKNKTMEEIYEFTQ